MDIAGVLITTTVSSVLLLQVRRDGRGARKDSVAPSYLRHNSSPQPVSPVMMRDDAR